MIAAGNSSREKIKLWLKDLNNGWDQLLNNCKEKKCRLQQAYEAMQFQRSLDDLEEWLRSIEVEVAKEDCGTDLPSVSRLLKALQDLEEVVDGYLDRVQSLVDTAKEFSSKGNFLAQEIQQRVGQTVHGYNSLAEPLHNRRETLESWQLLFQFYRDLEDELLWIQDKTPSASSKDWGTSLQSTQFIVKKHQVVMQEIASRAPLVQAVQDAGQNLLRGQHFASHEISERLAELKDTFESLRRESESRGHLLQEAVKIQTFLSEVSELKLWLDEQRPALESSDFGKSEEATEVLLRKLDSGDQGLENKRLKIEYLQDSGTKLEHCGHPNSHLVSKSLPDVLEDYESLLCLSASRRTALEDQLNLYVFEREARELQNWLCSCKTLAESEDFGQDLEDVEVLQKKFEDFVAEVNTLGQNKLGTVQQLGRMVKSAEGPKREAVLHKLWDELIQNVKIRTENLKSAREVHQFDHDVDELKTWMSEKEVVLDSDDHEHDLLSIQALIRQHEGLERDLVVIEEEVCRIKEEGRGLTRKYSQVRASLSERQQEVEACWASLQAKAIQRRKRLGQAEAVQRYLTEWTELMAWLKETLSLVGGEGLGGKGTDLEQLIKRHEEYRVQIDKQLNKSQAVKDEGRYLLEEGDFMCQELEERLHELQELETRVQEVWEERRRLYQEELEILQLQRDLEQAEHWLSASEATLKSEEYGDSVSDVQELMKKQEDLEAMIQAQSDRFHALQKKKTQRLQGLHEEDGDSSSRTKLPRVTCLKRKPSDTKVPRPKPPEPISRTGKRSVPSPSIFSKPPPNPSTRTLSTQSPVSVSTLATLAPSRSTHLAPLADPPSPPSSTPNVETRISPRYKPYRLSTMDEEFLPPDRPPISPKPKLSFSERSSRPDVPTATPPVPPVSQTPPASPVSPPTSYVEARSPSVPVPVSSGPPEEDPPETPERPPPPAEDPHTSSRLQLDPPTSSHLQLDHREHADQAEASATLSVSTPDVRGQVSVTIDGTLEIKVRQGGNKGLESWDPVYAVLEGVTLNLFQDKHAAAQKSSLWPPIDMVGAVCKDNPYYRRKDHTFKIILEDGSQYLFAASSHDQKLNWVDELQNSTKSAISSDSEESRSFSKDTVDRPGSEQMDMNVASENGHGSRESVVSNDSGEGIPPPKPPHTYFDRHHYSADGGVNNPATSIVQGPSSLQSKSSPNPTPLHPQSLTDTGSKDKTKNKSVFKKIFGK
ncbi:hypothetical protein DPEC_G00291990 [Dallia pectoralis]|uniref:Uncharacterized protein n=1 Tax=Dallia pectoralis TaxID=75939 RepID=A0ACC2FI41_DALPE|nr:hypothetical protein DPEC_G00291990 [Dallia pectoralis]